MTTPEPYPGLQSVELAIFDVDQTLVFPKDKDFYSLYGKAVTQAVGIHFGLEEERAAEIVNWYRQRFGGGEQALFRGDIDQHFPDVGKYAANTSTLYDAMIGINPAGQFPPQPEIRAGLHAIRNQGVHIAALTSSPDRLSQAILAEAGYVPDEDFDMFAAYDREAGPPKMLRGDAIFRDIAEHFGVEPERTLAVGDSLAHDIQPALALDMKACWLTAAEAPTDFTGFTARHPLEIISALQNSTKP